MRTDDGTKQTVAVLIDASDIGIDAAIDRLLVHVETLRVGPQGHGSRFSRSPNLQ